MYLKEPKTMDYQTKHDAIYENTMTLLRKIDYDKFEILNKQKY